MKTESVFIVGCHHNHFRCGEPALLLGIQMCTPRDFPSRLCYHLRFDDGFEDWWPIDEDKRVYKFITLNDVVNGNIPPVTE